jgi:hypothetical protein
VQKFAQFWDIYPKKKNKQGALKAFEKIAPNDDLLQIILNAINEQCKTEQWIKDKGQYIPLPSTFLNNKRWEDEIEVKDERTPSQIEFDRILSQERNDNGQATSRPSF